MLKCFAPAAVFLAASFGLFSADISGDLSEIERSLGGVVIAHSPAQSGRYIGSPSLCLLPDGAMLAMHDHFGKPAREMGNGRSGVYRSEDGGKNWRKVAQFDVYFGKLFFHSGAAYILALETRSKYLSLRKSSDGGKTWSEPKDENSGLISLAPRGFFFHMTSTATLAAKGRLWIGMEAKRIKSKWEDPFWAVALSADENADLLKSESWKFSEKLCFDKGVRNAQFANWLECNMVADAQSGELFIMPRVTSASDDISCLIRVENGGDGLSFNPDDIFRFPGGGKKFVVRYDEQSKKYWALTNWIAEEFRGRARNGRMRNTVALASAEKLGGPWRVESVPLKADDDRRRGFQYLDWHFDGDDIVALSRSAAFDGSAHAHNQHDANFLVFHRVKDFRKRTMQSELLNDD